MKAISLISICILLFSCKKEQKTTIDTATPEILKRVTTIKKTIPFTIGIENAHKKDTYLAKNTISYDIDIKFGGQTHLSGTITQLTDGTKIRIDKSDNTKIIYDSKNVFICPKDANTKAARFDIFTWSYFQNLAYKLNDPGTIWTSKTQKKLDNNLHETAKLTFEPKTGDAPDDWYVVYKTPKSNLLAGTAYIVTFGKDLADAEKEPHAIKYNNYKLIDGIPIATNWTFHMWNENDGYGETIGEVNIKNIKFLNESNELYKQPENSKIATNPNKN